MTNISIIKAVLPTMRSGSNSNILTKDYLTIFQPYMMTTPSKDNHVSNINDNSLSNNIDIVNIEKSITPSTKNMFEPINYNVNLVTPRQEDSLFWCIYIAINTYDDYLMINNKHNALEVEWKQQLSKQIVASPSKLKQSNHKTTKSNIQEILSDFMTSPYTTKELCIIAITSYYNIHIIIMNSMNNMRMEFLTHSFPTDTYIIYKGDSNQYSICLNPATVTDIANIRSNSFLIETNVKPLKSIGSYKVDELVQYAKLFRVYNDREKYNKTTLYELISDYTSKYNIIFR